MKLTKLLLIPLFFATSCVKEFQDTYNKVSRVSGVQWNPTLAIPLVYSDIGMQDILAQAEDFEYIRVEADGSLSAIYSDVLFSQNAEDAVNLADQMYTQNFVLTPAQLSALASAGTVTFTQPATIAFNYAGNEVDLIRFKAGQLVLGVSTSMQHDVSFRMIDTDNSIDESVNATYSGTLPNTGLNNVNMTGREIDFRYGSQGHSEITASLEVTITERPGNPINSSENVEVSLNIVNQQFSYLEGLFNGLNFADSSQTVNVGFFEGSTGGTFTLADPRVKLIFTSSAGIPIDANIIQFDGTNEDNNTVSLSGYPSPLPIPSLTKSEIGQSKSDSFELTDGNSNIVAYINNRPSTNVIDATMVTNPSGSTPRNWMLDTSRIEVKVEIVVPLHGTATGYGIEATEPFQLEFDGSEQLEEVLFRLFTVNGFPIDIKSQVYFEDSNSNSVLDSLLGSDRLIMPAASVDGSGRVSQTNPKTVDILFDADRVSQIQMANRIRIVSELNTTEQGGSQPDVKIYDDYNLHLELGVQAKVLLDQEI